MASSGVQSEQMNEVGFSLGGSAEALLFNSTLINRASFSAVTVFYQCRLSSLPLPLSAAFLPQLSQCQPLLVALYHVGGSFTAFFAVTFSCNYILKLKYPQVSSFLLSVAQFKLPLGSIHGPAFITLICKCLKALHLQLSFLTSKTLLFLTHFA